MTISKFIAIGMMVFGAIYAFIGTFIPTEVKPTPGNVGLAAFGLTLITIGNLWRKLIHERKRAEMAEVAGTDAKTELAIAKAKLDRAELLADVRRTVKETT